MVLLKDHTQVGMAGEVSFTLVLLLLFSPNKLKWCWWMLREIIYPKPISKDNNVEILSFCIYNIICNTVNNNSQYYVGDHTQPTYQRNMLFTYLLTCITLEDFLHVSLEFYSVIYLSFYFFDCSILETHSLFKCHLRTGPHFLAISGTCMGKGSELDLPCSLLNSLRYC